MNRTSTIIDLIVCPFCTAPLNQTNVLRRDRRDRIEYGVLSCSGCGFEYPVVAGIPILLAPNEAVDSKSEINDLPLMVGPQVSDLVQLIKTSQLILAFSLLLNPAKLDEKWLFSLEFPPGTSPSGAAADPDGGTANRESRLRRVAKKALRRRVLPRVRLRLARFLMADADNLTAVQAMDLYYRRYSRTENFNYFAYRFGQPRHLAALSLASQFHDRSGAVLDLACGTGHVTHFLSAARPDRAVIGVDREFFRLWIASQYLAPDAYFVCAPGDRGLPFRDRVFDGVFCSDAFHYFLHKTTCVREIQRVLTPDGIAALARVGNAAVEPREGYELRVDGYTRLFHEMRNTLVGEQALVRSYLDRRGPDLDRCALSRDLEAEKWLSIVASREDGLFRSGSPFAEWPHALGELRFNPIYSLEKAGSEGDIELRFQFPSERYEFENAGYRSYAPERCHVPAALVKALARGERPDAVEDLIAKFVVIGMPRRYY